MRTRPPPFAWPLLLALGIVLAALPVGASAQGVLTPQLLMPGRPLDPAEQALIEELARKAGEVAGAPGQQQAAGAMLERAQAAAARAAGDAPGTASQTAGTTPGPTPGPTALRDALARAQAASAAVTGATAPGGVPGTPPAAKTSVAAPANRPLILFVSWSMGEGALVEALRAAVADGHTRIVLRGVLPGERIGDAVRRVAPLVRDHVPGASIDFDPPAFRRAGVVSVPTIFDPVSASQWRGSAALDAFRSRLAETGEKFSDQVGPETVIAEPDLEEVMQAQAARLDFTGMRDRAYQAFWTNVALVTLPTVETSRERVVDPTMVLPIPLKDAQGVVIVPAGSRINALEARPWSHRLIVFDATDPRQMAWAVRQAGTALPTKGRPPAQGGLPAIFLTTSVERDAGWDGWQRLVSTLGAPLYVLAQPLADRLDVRAVPSVIVQDGPVLRVREIGRDEVRSLVDAPSAGIANAPAN
jgi:conjugal transfer pilus assembly protein TraW